VECYTEYPPFQTLSDGPRWVRGHLDRGEVGHYALGVTKVMYDNGCVRNGKWYAGEEWVLPKLPKGFKIILSSGPNHWGYRIVKESSHAASA